jgi:threonylcarbamoyladenosine tRNA methylthiotransferase MtaB
VINTCTVTGKAAMQSRQAIRQAIRSHPKAKIVVTGCYAQISPQEIQAIEGVEYVVGHADKLGIAQMLEEVASTSEGPVLLHRNLHQARCFDPMPSVAPASRTRAFLKIQDGCDAYCSYCIVPHARGHSRSMPVQEALRHIDHLVKHHYKEIVLTGIHLGAYGKDLLAQTSLYEFIELIHQDKRANRIRLSSIEPTEVDANLINLMAAPESPLCPHFHIPLQSGDDTILKRMGRPYTRRIFSEVIQRVRTKLAHAAIGADVLVGFPGEDDYAFNQTYDLIDSLDVTYLHVFPFSPRIGTPAATFKNRVPDPIVKARCKRLRKLGEKKKACFYQKNIHRLMNVLIEKSDDQTGDSRGVSDNYIPVILPKAGLPENTLVAARIQSIDPNLNVIAKPVSCHISS